MRRQRRFVPTDCEPLEQRLALSRGAHIAPVTPRSLDLSGRGTSSLAQQVANQVNVAFNSFTSDYLQAQGAYFASQDGSGAALKFFRSYITNRLDLLDQQLVRTFSHVPGSLNRLPGAAPGGSAVLQVFLRRYITGTTRNSLRTALAGSPQNDPIPPANTSGSTTTLYTSQALIAIQTAQTSTLNSVMFLIKHSFKTKPN
jgi:hypothetical protein